MNDRILIILMIAAFSLAPSTALPAKLGLPDYSSNLCQLALGAGDKEARIIVSSSGQFSQVDLNQPADPSFFQIRGDRFAEIRLLPDANEIIRDAEGVKQLGWFTSRITIPPKTLTDLIGDTRPCLFATSTKSRNGDENVSEISIALSTMEGRANSTYADIALTFKSKDEFKLAITSLNDSLQARGKNHQSPSAQIVTTPTKLSIAIPAMDLSNLYNRYFLNYLIQRFGPDSRVWVSGPG